MHVYLFCNGCEHVMSKKTVMNKKQALLVVSLL